MQLDPTVPHGTPGGYTKHGCRCRGPGSCTETHAKAQRRYRKSTTPRQISAKATAEAPPPHRTRNRYYSRTAPCREECCREAANEYQRLYRRGITP